MPIFKTFRDQRMSLLQSAAQAVLSQRESGDAAGPVTDAISSKQEETLNSIVQLGDALKKKLPLLHKKHFGAADLTASPAALEASPKFLSGLQTAIGAARGTIGLCGKLAFEYAEAKVVADTERVKQIEDSKRFSSCDANFLREIATKYVAYFELSRQEIIRHEWHAISDFVDNDVLTPASGNAAVRVALMGDWGTADAAARRVLEAIASKKPDVVIHLGDIYYSGIRPECERVLNLYREILPKTPFFTLSGNHDMFSGGQGYYWMLKEIDQPSSYFCLRNEQWQIIAIDTGYHGHHPTEDFTWLEQKDIDWAVDKIANADGRKTVLLSHHQPFSAFELAGHDGINDKLMGAFEPVMDKIDVWFCGHEHRLVMYDAFQKLQRLRCIGHGAIPTFAEDQYNTLDPMPAGLSFKRNDGVVNPDDLNALLPIADGVYARGFAILELNTNAPTAEYFDEGDFSKARYSEPL